MKADYIKEIIKKYDKMPYDCILIDGTWGIGKTYAIKDALKERRNVCFVSLFGMKDVQQIFHETFYQLGLKDKKGIQKIISRLIDVIAVFSKKVGVAKGILESIIKEKELFFELTKTFQELHIIVIDDLERMNDSISMEEMFGIIDEIKSCNYVKVILVANTSEIRNKEVFEKYSEKVIDRIYQMTEHTDNIAWSKLNINCGFINQFLKVHKVRNLRTLQKAQNLYDDVRLQLKDEYMDAFYDEIRLACYGIVVESTDGLYYRENEDTNNDPVSNVTFNLTNRLEFRIKNHYLRGVRISGNMVDIIQKYYENKAEINAEEVDGEYQIFLHAGDKANYYKSDEEMKLVLPKLAENIRMENNIGELIKYADEYLIWSEHLELDTKQILTEYEQKIHDMIFAEVVNGKLDYLSYTIDIHIQSETNRNIINKLIQDIKIELVRLYVQYLSEDTHGDLAYDYSYNLRNFMNNTYYKKAVSGNIDGLYNKKSFPIDDVTETQYRTSYNIMNVMYMENRERFLQYCNELKKSCDHMARHRIDVLLKEITGEEQ